MLGWLRVCGETATCVKLTIIWYSAHTAQPWVYGYVATKTSMKATAAESVNSLHLNDLPASLNIIWHNKRVLQCATYSEVTTTFCLLLLIKQCGRDLHFSIITLEKQNCRRRPTTVQRWATRGQDPQCVSNHHTLSGLIRQHIPTQWKKGNPWHRLCKVADNLSDD